MQSTATGVLSSLWALTYKVERGREEGRQKGRREGESKVEREGSRKGR